MKGFTNLTTTTNTFTKINQNIFSAVSDYVNLVYITNSYGLISLSYITLAENVLNQTRTGLIRIDNIVSVSK